MSSLTTEIRLYFGETGPVVQSSHAGLVVGQRYHITYRRLGSGVLLKRIHGVAATGVRMMSEARFEQWWVLPEAGGE